MTISGQGMFAGRIRGLALVLAGALAFSAPMAQAGDGPVLVELFTSQGCSSCPPADAHLAAELANREDVIALALHVDYWDYIGWKDQFAIPQFTKRQKSYAAAAGDRTIYTPQMIVAGKDHVVGYKPMELARLIETHRAKVAQVSLSVMRDGPNIVITLKAADGAGPLPPEMIVQLVRYLPSKTVEITRGENAGRTITYANIVTDWQRIDTWNGRAPYNASVVAPGDDKAVVVVQAANAGPVLASARAK